jgi:hypothetical protein
MYTVINGKMYKIYNKKTEDINGKIYKIYNKKTEGSKNGKKQVTGVIRREHSIGSIAHFSDVYGYQQKNV